MENEMLKIYDKYRDDEESKVRITIEIIGSENKAQYNTTFKELFDTESYDGNNLQYLIRQGAISVTPEYRSYLKVIKKEMGIE